MPGRPCVKKALQSMVSKRPLVKTAPDAKIGARENSQYAWFLPPRAVACDVKGAPLTSFEGHLVRTMTGQACTQACT